MTIFKMFGNFIAGRDPTTPMPPPDFRSTDTTAVDEPSMSQFDETTRIINGTDLGGNAVGLEYVDSKNIRSRRWVTVHNLKKADDGTYFVWAHCHLRDAFRGFRLDRIRHVIDADGTILDPIDFFTDLYPEVSGSIKALPLPKPKPGSAQRQAARDGIRVLCALGRADGMLHNNEIAVIIEYVKAQATTAGIVTTSTDVDALIPYIRRQSPSTSIVNECLDRLATTPVSQQMLFLTHAHKLAAADGVLDPSEFSFLIELEDSLRE